MFGTLRAKAVPKDQTDVKGPQDGAVFGDWRVRLHRLPPRGQFGAHGPRCFRG